MTKETKKTALVKAKTDMPAKFRKLFGPPPLLECEDIDAYYDHVSALIEETKPRSTIELMDIKTIADKFVEMQRFARIKPNLIEHAHEVRRQHLEGQIVSAAVSKGDQARDRAKAQLTKDLKNLKGEPEQIKAETERLKRESDEKLQAEIAKIKDESKGQLEELADTAASEADHAATFHDWIDPYEHADQLERGAWAQSLAAFDQLERHQAGLGLHRVQEIEDVEYHVDKLEQGQLTTPETTTMWKGVADTAEPPAAAPEPPTVCGNQVNTDSTDIAVAIEAAVIRTTSVSSGWEGAMLSIDITERMPPEASESREAPVPAGEAPVPTGEALADRTTSMSLGGEIAMPPSGMPPEASESREASVSASEVPADCITSVSSVEEGALPPTEITEEIPPEASESRDASVPPAEQPEADHLRELERKRIADLTFRYFGGDIPSPPSASTKCGNPPRRGIPPRRGGPPGRGIPPRRPGSR